MTAVPPDAVEQQPPDTPGGPTIWRYRPGGWLGTELWLLDAQSGDDEPAHVHVQANGHTIRNPEELAVLGAMFTTAAEWLTRAQADDGAQLRLDVEATT